MFGDLKDRNSRVSKLSRSNRGFKMLAELGIRPAVTYMAELKNRLKALLFDELKQQKDPRMFGQGHIFDEYPYAKEQTRNFYERYMNGEKISAGWVNETDFEKPGFAK